MRTHRLATIALGMLAAGACRDVTPPARVAFTSPSFLVTPMFVDTVGICLGTGSPSGSYTFAYTIQNQQPGDINDVPSPVTANLNPHECLVAWRRLTPLPGGVVVTAIVDVLRSEEHTSELQSHSDLHSFPTRRSSDLTPSGFAWARGVRAGATLSPTRSRTSSRAISMTCRRPSPRTSIRTNVWSPGGASRRCPGESSSPRSSTS